MSDDEARIRDLIERSSLGTAEATALRASVSDEHAERIVARARELEAEMGEMGEPAKRKKRSGSERRQLTKQVAVRLTPREYEALSRRASTLGMSVPALIRRDSLRRTAGR